MDPTMSEIRLFAGNYAPLSWSFCNGNLLSISENTALFALLGTTYGGDGQVTFALPDLRGRVPIGTGQGPGLNNVDLGQISGAENYTLTSQNLAMHTHTVSGGGTVPVSGTISATMAVNSTSNASEPNNNFLGSDGGGNGGYASSPSSTGTVTDTLALGAISVNTSGLSVSISSVQTGITGGSQPVNNMQPYLGLNYIICVEGIFPSRN